jgi:hypothetical protein
MGIGSPGCGSPSMRPVLVRTGSRLTTIPRVPDLRPALDRSGKTAKERRIDHRGIKFAVATAVNLLKR